MTCEEAIKIVDRLYIDYFKRNYEKPQSFKMKFKYFSYSRWSLNEIKRWLIESENEDPLEVLYCFSDIMLDYACLSKNGDSNFIFSTACDTAKFVIDELILEKIKI